jgi:hypothetical protein
MTYGGWRRVEKYPAGINIGLFSVICAAAARPSSSAIGYVGGEIGLSAGPAAAASGMALVAYRWRGASSSAAADGSAAAASASVADQSKKKKKKMRCLSRC